jgi:hypothetical protein
MGDDSVPVDILKLLGEDGLKLVTQLINKMYGSGEWGKDFIEVAACLKKLQNAATIAPTAERVERVLLRRIEEKREVALGEG